MTKQRNIIGSVDEALAASFKALAEKKPIEKITIKEITDLTGVIRPTFYNHFQDKYELLEWIVRNHLMEPCMSCIDDKEFEKGVSLFCETIRDDSKFYQSCARLTGQNSFFDILKGEIARSILNRIDEKGMKKKLWYDWLSPARITDFFAESLTYAIVSWIKTDMQIPEEELLECFMFLSSHSILELVIGVALDM